MARAVGVVARARRVPAGFAAAGFVRADVFAAPGFVRAAGLARDAAAVRLGRCAAGAAAGFGLLAALALARAGVSVAAAAAGAAGVAPRAGPSRFALRRAGRERGRLVRTSCSLPFDPESLGGMARFLPIA